MNSRAVMRRLRAFQAGKPLPRGSTIHHVIASDEDLLLVAFVRMGGESRPWGIAWGHPGEEPRFLTVPEARDRDAVGEMAASFAPALLKHLRVPGYVASPPANVESLSPLRQIWLPNRSHLDMLHHLAYAYAYTTWGDEKNASLKALGRTCNWLQLEAQRPGQQHVIVATTALREAYTFPAEDLRQGHLGYLLGWLEGEGDRDSRMRLAMQAERKSVSSSLDPGLERKDLEPELASWRQARDAGDARAMDRHAQRIEEVLTDELRRRLSLAEAALQVLRADPREENAGLRGLTDHAATRQWWDLIRNERLHAGTDVGRSPTLVSVETDRSATGAAARYLEHESSDDRLRAALVHNDAEVLAEAIGAGEAFAGVIASVRDEGSGRSVVPVWVVRSRAAASMRLRAGSRVCVVGFPSRTGEIRAITEEGSDLLFELEIKGCKTKPRNATGMLRTPAADRAWEGTQVAFCQESMDSLAVLKRKKLWASTGPGAWLTHARAGGGLARVDAEDGETTPVAGGVT